MTNRNAPGEVDAILDRCEKNAKKLETTDDVLAAPEAEQDLLQHLQGSRESLKEAQQYGKQVVRSWGFVENNLQAVGLCEKLKRSQDSERWALSDGSGTESANEMQIEDEDEWDNVSEVWFDHPGQSFHLPDVWALGIAAAPLEFCGHLWKKSPPPALPIKRWKWRWILLLRGRMHWYASVAEDKCGQWKLLRGEINFVLNHCSVSLESGDHQFCIRPIAGKWTSGSFTGARVGREFHFDCRGSEHGRDQWVHAIESHMGHGEQVCG